MIGTTAAILGAAALGTAGSVIAGSKQAKAAKQASDAQVQATQLGIDFQKDAARQARVDAYPWALAGSQALYKYMDELGIPRPQTPILPDLNAGPLGQGEGGTGTSIASPANIPMTAGAGFRETPGYQFQVEEGEKGVLNNLAALGMKNSGAALKALTRFRSGLADQEYGTWLNRLGQAAGMGQAQTQANNSLLQSTANNISGMYQDQGNARASGYVGQANAWGNAIGGVTNNLAGGLGAYAYMNQPNALGRFPAAPALPGAYGGLS